VQGKTANENPLVKRAHLEALEAVKQRRQDRFDGPAHAIVGVAVFVCIVERVQAFE
jgi:hypothetical protein